MKYEPLEKLNAEAAAAAEAAQAEKCARASGSCRILSLKQEERRIKKEAAEQARAAKAARAAAALEHRAARAAAPRAAPRAAAGCGPVVDEQPAVAMEEEDAEEEEEEEDPVDEASDEDDLEAELLAEQGPPLLLPLPDPTERMRLHPDARALEVPGDIHAKLKPYQVEGVAFLHRRWCQRPLRAGEARGCVLGDDMARTCAFVPTSHSSLADTASHRAWGKRVKPSHSSRRSCVSGAWSWTSAAACRTAALLARRS